MHLTDKEPLFPLLVENKILICKMKKRHHSTQPFERRAEHSIDSFHEKSFLVKKKELQFRTLETKKPYIVMKPKATTLKENIPEVPSFDKILNAFLQYNATNPEKNQKLKKQSLKIITQHHELNVLEEEHRSLQGRFFTEIQSYLSECQRL